jgi:hypothetical protein
VPVVPEDTQTQSLVGVYFHLDAILRAGQRTVITRKRRSETQASVSSTDVEDSGEGEILFGINAEGKSLEDVTKPLTAVTADDAKPMTATARGRTRLTDSDAHRQPELASRTRCADSRAG